MANADELCQFARLGQILKIQKCLQTHNVDINALNLCGESALSTATYHNQIVSVACLLANKADPKLRLSAGHTAIHIACRSANVSILNLLLSVKKNESDELKLQAKEDKHIYQCLKIKDNANLTPIHWAATHASVSKRQKIFAYLDKRMPGVLDSRYNITWFDSWAQTHPWVLDEQSIKTNLSISSIPMSPTLTNIDIFSCQNSEQRSSLPLLNQPNHANMSPRTSLNSYERPPRSAAKYTYDNTLDEQKNCRSPKIQHTPLTPQLPPTPTTSRKVSFTNHISKGEHRIKEYCNIFKPPVIDNPNAMTPPKTPYFQRLTSIVKNSLSPLSDRSTYRAERAHVIPTFIFPSSPTIIENKQCNADEIYTSLLNKRPSHNLLSNILPSTTTSLSDQISQQSAKPFDSNLSMNINNNRYATQCERFTYNYIESLPEDNDNDNEASQFDYLCKSASSLDISSPGAYISDV